MAKKRGKIATWLYFGLLSLLLLILALHIFNIYPLQTDFFSRYVLALIFALMLLPLIPKIKIFDFVEVRREAKMFKAAKKK